MLGASLAVLLCLLLLLRYLSLIDEYEIESMVCGQEILLENYQVFSKLQLDETTQQILGNVGNKKFKLNELSNQVKCYMHSELYSQGYFMSKPKGKSYFLQAVHAHDDLYTGEIVGLMMQEENSAKYASLSSLKRQVLDSSSQESLINSVSEELITSDAISAVIQLHGFSQKKRKSRKAKEANIIVSSGDKDSTFLANTIYHCLNQHFTNVHLFGKNIYELGATENYLHLALQEKAYMNNFIHIELSLNQRKNLLDNREIKKLNLCLAQGELNETLS